MKKTLPLETFALPYKHLYLLFQSPIKQKSNMHVRDQTKLAVCISISLDGDELQ